MSGGEHEQDQPQRRRLPTERTGVTHAFSIGDMHGTITANLEDGEVREFFVDVDKPGDTLRGLIDAVAICTSVALQHGIELEVLATKFIGSRFEPAGFTSNPDIPRATSPLDYIFRWLRQLEARKRKGPR
ncbi:MAG: hypothetical protein KC503_46535 [Myxococcales bacterium]|nr:hypothetical protein [Myxococcales bacterium]